MRGVEHFLCGLLWKIRVPYTYEFDTHPHRGLSRASLRIIEATKEHQAPPSQAQKAPSRSQYYK